MNNFQDYSHPSDDLQKSVVNYWQNNMQYVLVESLDGLSLHRNNISKLRKGCRVTDETLLAEIT